MSTLWIVLRLVALIAFVVLVMYLVHLLHKKELEHNMKSFEVTLNKSSRVRASFTREEYEGNVPVVRDDIYGKHLEWDFKSMRVTWWYVGNPDNKRTATIIPLDK